MLLTEGLHVNESKTEKYHFLQRSGGDAKKYKYLGVGMSSHFLNFIFKTSQYHQMKALHERISEWPHLAL